MSDAARPLRGIPITDHHVHLRPDGRREEAVREFARRGGTRILLVHAPYEDLQPTPQRGFEPAYLRTLETAERVREAMGVEVLVALGPHPVELLFLANGYDLSQAYRVVRRGLDRAQGHVLEGRAVAIGEVGRPHFPVDPTLWEASNRLLHHAMELAKEADCPLILHTEDPSPTLFQDLAARADEAGLPRDRVVKHFADPSVRSDENWGIFPSVVVKEDYAERAARKGTRFLMETDYLDDPRRPGAVLGPATVPRRSAELLRNGILAADDLHRIHEENVQALYGT